MAGYRVGTPPIFQRRHVIYTTSMSISRYRLLGLPTNPGMSLPRPFRLGQTVYWADPRQKTRTKRSEPNTVCSSAGGLPPLQSNHDSVVRWAYTLRSSRRRPATYQERIGGLMSVLRRSPKELTQTQKKDLDRFPERPDTLLTKERKGRRAKV